MNDSAAEALGWQQPPIGVGTALPVTAKPRGIGDVRLSKMTSARSASGQSAQTSSKLEGENSSLRFILIKLNPSSGTIAAPGKGKVADEHYLVNGNRAVCTGNQYEAS